MSEDNNNADINCCAEPETVECCSSKAAVTLVGLSSGASAKTEDVIKPDPSAQDPKDNAPVLDDKPPSNEDKPPADEDAAKDPVGNKRPRDVNVVEETCPRRRRRRTVSVDFSDPCSCCPPHKKERKLTFVEDLALLADFLKRERSVLRSTNGQRIEKFYQPAERDSELVAEWRRSGGDVYSTMIDKLRRLEDMEAKFGKWEEHFA